MIDNGGASERQATVTGELWASRVATVVLVTAALALTFLFSGQNVGFLSAMGYAVAASANFSVLLLRLFWRGQTAAGEWSPGWSAAWC